MATSILVPMDDSSPSEAALLHAFSTYPDAEITVLHVVDTATSMAYGQVSDFAGMTKFERPHPTQVIEEAEDIATEYDRDLTTITKSGSASRRIITYAADHDIDHIVMGSHGREGISRLLLGSVAERVIRQAPVPVTVVH